MKLVYIVLFILAIAVYNEYQDRKYIQSFKTGEKTLTCNMQDGVHIIEPNKIVSVDFETNTFIFTNGSATSCEVSK